MAAKDQTGGRGGATGKAGELHQQAGDGHPELTTNQGVPVADNHTRCGRTNAAPPCWKTSSPARSWQLAGSPSVLFDAVAVLLAPDAAQKLRREAAAVQFVKDAFGHLKAIAHDEGGRILLDEAGIAADAGVVMASDTAAFIEQAGTRQWEREPKVRMLP